MQIRINNQGEDRNLRHTSIGDDSEGARFDVLIIAAYRERILSHLGNLITDQICTILSISHLTFESKICCI